MSALVNCVRSRVEILVLNSKLGMDASSAEYTALSRSAVDAIKQVGAGVKSVGASELEILLKTIADAPLADDFRAELRDTFNAKLGMPAGKALKYTRHRITSGRRIGTRSS